MEWREALCLSSKSPINLFFLWNLELQDMKCDTKHKPLDTPNLYHAQYKNMGTCIMGWCPDVPHMSR